MQLHLLSRLRSVFSGKTKTESDAKTQRRYSKPTARKLTSEQTKLKVIGHAVAGNQGAKELMELLYKDSAPKPSHPEERSA